jgi:hypothetical protein
LELALILKGRFSSAPGLLVALLYAQHFFSVHVPVATGVMPSFLSARVAIEGLHCAKTGVIEQK